MATRLHRNRRSLCVVLNSCPRWHSFTLAKACTWLIVLVRCLLAAAAIGAATKRPRVLPSSVLAGCRLRVFSVKTHIRFLNMPPLGGGRLAPAPRVECWLRYQTPPARWGQRGHGLGHSPPCGRTGGRRPPNTALKTLPSGDCSLTQTVACVPRSPAKTRLDR